MNLLKAVLKNKTSNKIFTFLSTLLIFTVSCIVSLTLLTGLGSFLIVFCSGAISLNLCNWSEEKFLDLNEEEDE